MAKPKEASVTVRIPAAHPKQREFIESPAKRKIIRAGRRGGKTVGVAILAVKAFLAGKRVLYAAPTAEQIDRFWHEIKLALHEPIEAKVFYKNETSHIIEESGTERRLRAKTAWNANSLRGDYADLLILDEWQLMDEDAWDRVGAPMLMDNDGDAVFIYTPPTLATHSMSKAKDPRHAAKRFKNYARLEADYPERYATFHFTSRENPFISTEAVDEVSGDMSQLAYRMEILAEDIDEVPGALWTMHTLDDSRVSFYPDLHRIVVGVDPQATTGQTGIVVVGFAYVSGQLHGFTLADRTAPAGVQPATWGQAVVDTYYEYQADIIVGEINNGGDMVESVIRAAEGGKDVNYSTVRASRGKHTRAEPVAALFVNDENRNKKARCHMVGNFPFLEDECISWVPGAESPNRLDAMVWAYTEGLWGKDGANFQIVRNTSSLYGSRQQSQRHYNVGRVSKWGRRH